MINQSRRIVSSLLIKSMVPFSRSDLINVPPAKYADHRDELLKNGWRDTDPTHKVLYQSNKEIITDPFEQRRISDPQDSSGVLARGHCEMHCKLWE